MPSWNPSAHVLVLMYYNYDSSIFEDKQKEILATFLEYNMLDIKLVTYRQEARVLDVKTWFPFANNNCASRVSVLQLISKCEFNDIDHKFIEYPVRDVVIPKHLPGCELRISTSIQEPYVYYDHKTKNFSGMEIALVKAIAEEMEMIPIFILINETRANRAVDNQTGIYSLLFQR